jgi:hypothetical protein
MPQNTNLNVSPYFDDFNRSNNYNKVLFKPATPIQARELTTLQSILQDQIEQFGNHFFKEGSVVIPGQIAYESEYTSVQINDSFAGIPISTYIDNLIGVTLKGEISGVTAKVENYYSPIEDNVTNYTLFIKYQSSSDTNFTTKTFVDGENLITLQDITYSLSTIKANTSVATSIITNSTSVGSAAKIADGVYFIRGFFVSIPAQTVILDAYTNTPSYRVGLLINEEIAIASNEYPDLFDNANGFSNFAADGADRLKITATLIKKSISDFNDQNFIELLRVENGIIQKFVKDTQYNIIEDEIARRAYDQSGDYYVRPFSVELKESLNNKTGNNGIYNNNQQTKQGNIPSNNLACLSISPGKAYVRGYEIETISTTIIDAEKPRDTDKIYNEYVPFNIGKQIELNNIYGSVPVGFGATSEVKLYNERTKIPGVSSGTQIGVARVYDLSFDSSNYEDNTTTIRCSLYDIQTYTTLVINSSITKFAPAFIKGQNSGATGYLLNNITNSNTLTLYQVSGSFSVGEQISGLGENRSISNVIDYNLSDVHQIVANEGISGLGTFTADPVLSNTIYIADAGTQFTISAQSAGVSAITASADNFYAKLKVGDIISYTKPGQTVPTYNKVSFISPSLNSIGIVSTTDVSNVCDGDLPTSQIPTISGVNKVSLQVLNTSRAFLYSNLRYNNISNLDLTSSELLFKKSYIITISSNSYSNTLETDPNLTLEPFAIENYNLTYNSSGIVETLTDQNLTVSGRTITLQNLSVSSGQATLTVTYKKIKASTRKKIYNRCASLVINNSSSSLSGIGSTTLNDGLTYSNVYGTRVQDDQISLNVCDVESVLGVFESPTTTDPSLPKLNLNNLSSNLLNSIIGERIIGTTSNSVAVLTNNQIANQIEIVYVNENRFIQGEQITFEESKLTAFVYSVEVGDFDIKNSFVFDNGQRNEFLDFSRIIRNQNVSAPTKALKIIYNYYSIDPTDNGDFVGANSYDSIRYGENIASINGNRVTDIIDVRPRVNSYTGNRSPFEYQSRIFNINQNSSKNIFANNKNINLSYSFYLSRIDKLFLSKDGTFSISKGVSSLTPKIPDSLNNALEIATIYYPAYLYNVKDANIIVSTHKRYTMKDISTLEDRLSNVEYFTSLSLLETDTQNLTIRDPQTQLDRFKCGFFVDNFRSIYGGDIANVNYKTSVDVSNGILRPQPYSTSIDLILGSESIIGIGTTANANVDINFVNDFGSSNIKKTGNVISLNYNTVEYTKNNFATRVENVNPFNTINWIGTIKLNPESDTWIDTRKTERTIDVEGSYSSAIQQLGVDTNTGLSPIDWGSWETNWSGTSISQGPVLGQFNQSSLISETGWVATSALHASRAPDGVMKQSQVNTEQYRDTTTTFNNQTVTTTSKQTRQGIQYSVKSRYDNASLGDRVVSREIITTMRSRNIEVIARRLKPQTKFYAFFDNVDVTSYVIPKLLEINMVSGSFIDSEIVIGILGSSSIRFRLAKQNHKYGPYNNPSEVYTQNPYQPSNSLSSSYSSTTTILNIDISSLGLNSLSEFFGFVAVGMKLVGQSSGAVATISDLRLISDSSGTFIGSFFIPDPILPSTPTFQTGNKTFLLTTSSTNSSIVGISESSAEANFTSSGTLDNIESSTLRIKNATIERNSVSDQKTITDTDTRIVANTTNSFRTTTQTRWVDPLAESFEVTDPNGVFITKCDIFFNTKDSNLPVTLQIRTMQNGIPTQTILPFGEVILDPNSVLTSSDASIPTTFTFSSPIYLESGNSYAIVLLSASNLYNVWISRMGEVDISTLNKPDSEKIIVSQQPTLGSLFKSQNGSTWDPSQLEDLKFVLYRADFVTSPSSIRFYNPDLGIGNNQIVSLKSNPISAYSKSLLVGLGNTLTNANLSNLIIGNTITQQNNLNFKGNLKSIVGSIGINSSLTITNPGTGFVNSAITYSNINLISLSGNGSGAKVDLSINNGVSVAATVSVGGSGYAYGDTLTVSSYDTGGFGNNLILSIPNTVGIISAYNSLIIVNSQGTLNQNYTDNIISTNSTGSQVITGAIVSYVNSLTDGLHFKVFHKNHGMYSSLNKVRLSGMESDITPSTLNSDYVSTTNDSIILNSIDNFKDFENIPVSAINPGYILIGSEIISYTGIDINSNLLTGITRGIDNTIPSQHNKNNLVFKYEFNGISLRRINKTHSFIDTDLNKYPIGIDDYHIKINTSLNGVDRTYGNANNFPELFFRDKKTGGSYLSSGPQSSSLTGPKSTQNITFNVVKPIIQTILPETTTITSKIRTISATSVNGEESPYLDQGFEKITLNSNNILGSSRGVLSKENENQYLDSTVYPGKKSLTLEMILSTNDSKVSPMIDLDRVSTILVMNRINNPISNFNSDPRVNSLSEDPNSSIYVSKKVKLEKSANGLKVIFDAFRHSTNDIRVLYRLFRNDTPDDQQLYELFPGYDNLDKNGNIINLSNNNGKSDRFVNPSTDPNDFANYEFNAKNLSLFNGFQIKIIMTGTNQSFVPKIRDLRVIATI